jgi:hypothetical protein
VTFPEFAYLPSLQSKRVRAQTRAFWFIFFWFLTRVPPFGPGGSGPPFKVSLWGLTFPEFAYLQSLQSKRVRAQTRANRPANPKGLYAVITAHPTMVVSGNDDDDDGDDDGWMEKERDGAARVRLESTGCADLRAWTWALRRGSREALVNEGQWWYCLMTELITRHSLITELIMRHSLITVLIMCHVARQEAKLVEEAGADAEAFDDDDDDDAGGYGGYDGESCLMASIRHSSKTKHHQTRRAWTCRKVIGG